MLTRPHLHHITPPPPEPPGYLCKNILPHPQSPPKTRARLTSKTCSTTVLLPTVSDPLMPPSFALLLPLDLSTISRADHPKQISIETLVHSQQLWGLDPKTCVVEWKWALIKLKLHDSIINVFRIITFIKKIILPSQVLSSLLSGSSWLSSTHFLLPPSYFKLWNFVLSEGFTISKFSSLFHVAPKCMCHISKHYPMQLSPMWVLTPLTTLSLQRLFAIFLPPRRQTFNLTVNLISCYKYTVHLITVFKHFLNSFFYRRL